MEPENLYAAPASKLELHHAREIEQLDVSYGWKQRFHMIANAGGPSLPKLETLAKHEQRRVSFSATAFFLGPFWYLYKGLWKQAIAYELVGAPLYYAAVATDHNQAALVVALLECAAFGTRASTSYYKKKVLGETPWL